MHRSLTHFPLYLLCALGILNLSACDGESDGNSTPCDSEADCAQGEICHQGLCTNANALVPKNCGNGVLDEGEVCDDGRRNGQPNQCSQFCDGTTPAVCGNGVVEEGEDCDDVGMSARCNDDCTAAVCGDGIINTWAGEVCDDGPNNGEPNHCDEWCEGTTRPTCGNGVVEEGEVCDDGPNNGEPNHCARNCKGTTTPVCGNGIIEDGEDCDDAGESETCNADCTASQCGDGIVNEWAGEICDDGPNNGTLDHCNTDCTKIITCGNGELDPGEFCDDGPNNGQPGHCNADCTGVDASICGNGIVEDGEDCDDAGESETCNANCTAATCGDGVVNYAAGEECDPGDQEDFACNSDCTAKAVAFRLDTVRFIDPHLYFDLLHCRDITDEGALGQLPGGANGMLQEGLEKTSNGTFNTSLALLIRPFIQQADAQTHVDFLFPRCEAPLGECSNDPAKPVIESTLTNHASGYCLPIQEHLGRNPLYQGLYKPAGPCFISDTMNIDINIRGISLALSDARVTATYEDTPATRLSSGILVGFLTEEAAQEAIVPAPSAVGGDTPLYEFLKGGGACGSGSDMDVHQGENGWWFYLNFTAEAADAWNE